MFVVMEISRDAHFLEATSTLMDGDRSRAWNVHTGKDETF